VPSPSKPVRTMTQRKQWLEVDQNWQQSSYLPLYRKQWNLWWLVKIWSRTTTLTLNFLGYMEPLFEKFVTRPISTQECSWTIRTERSWKMMKNGLTQHMPSTEKKTKWQKGVLCDTAGAKGVKVFGSENSVGLLFI
jgi:hypothetical protein